MTDSTSAKSISQPEKAPIIGIDLGTTNSLAATVYEHGPDAIRDNTGNPIIPSVLAWQADGQWVVGQPALAKRDVTPQHVVHSVKRLLGRNIAEIDTNLLHYAVQGGTRDMAEVVIEGQTYSPQRLSAEILRTVKQHAEQQLGQTIEKAVITVPAYFDDAQRQATRGAAKIAGLEAVRILNEPTAAAIAYGLEEKQQGIIAVYDLGGGTFDISILHLTRQVFKVLATHGDTQLGGDDFDNALAGIMKQRMLKQCPQVDLDTPLAGNLLRKIAEILKTALSSNVESPYQIQLAGVEFADVMQAETFEASIKPMIARTLQSCEHVLKAAGKTAQDITEVVLVGGSTRIPYVRRQVQEFFGRVPNVHINPDEVVAIGAGIQGHLLSGGRRDYLLLDVIPLSLGIETLGGSFNKLIMANSTIPTKVEEFYTTHADNQTGVDINIYQGEREFIRDCRMLGCFKLKGLPQMPAGLPRIKVTFAVDANGILTVSALEERSGTQASIDVIPSHGLTSSEIDRIMEESFEHADQDLQMRQLAEFRTITDAVFKGIHKAWPQIEKMLSAAEQQAIKTHMKAVQEAAIQDNPWVLKAALDELGVLTQPVADQIISDAALSELQQGDLTETQATPVPSQDK